MDTVYVRRQLHVHAYLALSPLIPTPVPPPSLHLSVCVHLYQFAYDNGLGSAADRFKIDLYYADIGRGDCGKWLTSICDKPDIGCKDSSETTPCETDDSSDTVYSTSYSPPIQKIVSGACGRRGES